MELYVVENTVSEHYPASGDERKIKKRIPEERENFSKTNSAARISSNG